MRLNLLTEVTDNSIVLVCKIALDLLPLDRASQAVICELEL